MHTIQANPGRQMVEQLQNLDPIHVAMRARVHRQTLLGNWLARLFGAKPTQNRDLIRQAF